MEELLDYREKLLERYVSIVDDYETALARFSNSDWHTPLEPDGWSVHRIMAHVRAVEDQAFVSRLQRILTEENPYFERFDEAAWMGTHYQPEEPLEVVFGGFARLRAQELDWIRQMPSKCWARTGRHPVWGLRTLQWWVEGSLAHNQEHLTQINQRL